VLLVLLKLDNLLLYHGNVLLPDVYISGVDNGLRSRCLWVPWYLQSWKAQHFACLYTPLCMWLAMALTVFLYSTFPMSKVWFLSPNTFCFSFADFRVVCCGDVFGPHSLCFKLRRHQFQFATICSLRYVSTPPTRVLKCSTYYVLVTSWAW
jgi:hypothetical protein